MRAARLRVGSCSECGAHDYGNAFCPTCHAANPSGCMSMYGPANFLGMGQPCPVCRPETEADRRRIVTCESCRGTGRCSSCDGLGRREIIDHG